MKNTFGTSITLTLFGESHGAMIGAVLDGLAPGISISEEEIAHFLSLRRPQGAISTARSEKDPFQLVSGVYRGKTTGTPLCILIPNEDARSESYLEKAALARPGHADFTAHEKYHGFEDPRGGGHFSGRITAPLVAAGAILSSALQKKGVRIGTHIASLAGVNDRGFENLESDIAALRQKEFAVLDAEKEKEMTAAILAAKADGDSVGGVLESCVVGMPAGVGEVWFDSVESLLSHAVFSIPAVKGIEFGKGFGFAVMRGSSANDPFCMENGRVRTLTNHNGGINGGITNGMPILFRTVIKPTPTIFREQQTVDYEKKENATLAAKGRHDPCIVHRARVVVDSITALVLADLLTQRFGTDFLGETK